MYVLAEREARPPILLCQGLQVDAKKPVFTVLVADPGGTGVMMPACYLEEIQKRAKGLPIPKMFDLMLGTSSSTILLAMLAAPDPQNPDQPLFTASAAKLRLRRFTRYAFQNPRSVANMLLTKKPKYEGGPLEKMFHKAFGDMKLKDFMTSVIFSAAGIGRNHPAVWMSSIKGKEDTSPEAWSTMRIRDALRAAVTIPFYFAVKKVETWPEGKPPMQHALIDGGFFTGNNIQKAYNIAKKIAPPDADIVVVHLGTGRSHKPQEANVFDKDGLRSLVTGGALNLISHLFLNAAARDTIETMKEELGDNFFSFNCFIDHAQDPDAPGVAVDDGSRNNMLRYERRVQREIASGDEKEIDRFCETFLRDRIEAHACPDGSGARFTAQTSEESQAAFEQLVTILERQPALLQLSDTYGRMLAYFDYEAKGTREDSEIRSLCLQLRDPEKDRLDQTYHTIRESMKRPTSLLGGIRRAGGTLSREAKRRFAGAIAINDNSTAISQAAAHAVRRYALTKK